MSAPLTENKQASRDHDFSASLKRHAAVLDMRQLVAVGTWEIAQAARKGRSSGFFLDFLSEGFTPFGWHHPLELSHVSTVPIPAHSFDPHLAVPPSWRWSVLDPRDPWVTDKTWGEDAPYFREDATLKAQRGWAGLDHLKRLKGWSVPLGPHAVFTASTAPNHPPTPAPLAGINAWVKLFFSPDVQGPTGRLTEVTSSLHARFPAGSWRGLNCTFPVTDPRAAAELLATQGIAVTASPEGIHLCFGLSFLPEDLDLLAAHLPKG